MDLNRFKALFEKSPEKLQETIEKEYLKMNRLTQKIIKYLLFIKQNDSKFGKFIIGVLFGDNFKILFENQKTFKNYTNEKIKFKAFVAEHLIKAEKLVSMPKINDNSDKPVKNISSLNFNYDAYNSVNISHNLSQTLNNFNNSYSKINSNDLDSPDNSKNQSDKVVSMDNKNLITINIMNKLNNSGTLKKTTFTNNQFNTPHLIEKSSKNEIKNLNIPKNLSKQFYDLFQENDFPDEYFDHWIFLRKKIRFYENQLDDLYSNLYKFKNIKTIDNAYQSNNAQVKYSDRFSDCNILNKNLDVNVPSIRKRNFDQFIFNKSQKENNNNNPRDQLFKSMFKKN